MRSNPCFIIVFYVYDSKIHFIYAIPFIVRFLVILSCWVCFSLSTMVFFHRQSCWLLFFELFFGFPRCPWVWPLTRISAYIGTTLLSDHIVAIYPPSEAWSWTCPLQWRWHRQWQLILQLHRTSIPSSCCWQPTRQNSSWIIIQRHSSWIIIRRCRADSARRWEHLEGFGKVSKVVFC